MATDVTVGATLSNTRSARLTLRPQVPQERHHPTPGVLNARILRINIARGVVHASVPRTGPFRGSPRRLQRRINPSNLSRIRPQPTKTPIVPALRHTFHVPEVRDFFPEGVFVQNQETAIVAVIAAAVTVIACFALSCLTFSNTVKSALQDSDSAHRAKILTKVATVLRHLPLFRWRRK
ncbi:hypothetical protein ACIRL0_06805 [Streptomyces sp. NPDC102365]|uniref:hypothetical protein n=1 Tax=Streptomyces sp. NPDC102365 TaxID=3366162 RepID=UPI00382C2204